MGTLPPKACAVDFHVYWGGKDERKLIDLHCRGRLKENATPSLTETFLWRLTMNK